MTLRLLGEVRLDGDQAKAELRDIKSDQDQVTKSTGAMGAASQKAAADNRRLRTEIAGGRTAVNQLGTASRNTGSAVFYLGGQQQRAAQDALQFGSAQARAAGQTGNLVAQFNDIGVMLAAGQNPLQLAIQQGTQVTQVIGPMGATGAVKSLGAAFLGMLAPINLITIGAIAAGAYMVQWLTRATEDVETLEDQFSDLDVKIAAVTQSNKDAGLSQSDMIVNYGSMSAAASEILEINRQIAAVQAEAALKSTTRSLASSLGLGDAFDFASADIANIGATIDRLEAEREKLNAATRNLSDSELAAANKRQDEISSRLSGLQSITANFSELNDMLGISDEQALEVVQRFAEIGSADGAVRQAELMIGLSTYISSVSDNLANASEEGEAFYNSLVKASVSALELAKARVADAATARGLQSSLAREVDLRKAIEQSGENSVRTQNLRRAHEREDFAQRLQSLRVEQSLRASILAQWDAANPRRNWYKEQATAARSYFQSVLSNIRQQGVAELGLLQTEQRRASILQAELQYGRDSVQAVEARHAAQRAELEIRIQAEVKSRDLAEAMRENLRLAQEFEKTNLAGPITSAEEAAVRLASKLGIALDIARKVAATGYGLPENNTNPQSGGHDQDDPRAPWNQGKPRWTDGYSTTYTPPGERTKSKRGGGGGGARAIEREREAIRRLIEDQRRQIEILRETDPVQKEMIRYREQMANATDAEREALQKLIGERLKEEAAVARASETNDWLRQTSMDTLDALIVQGQSASEVWNQVAASIARAALEALIFGEGPFSDWLGGGVMNIFGGVGLADGGHVGAHAVGVPQIVSQPLRLAGGGRVWGEGGSREDKVPAFLSPDEHVINARAARKHRPLLEAINSGVALPALADGGSLTGSTSAPSGALSALDKETRVRVEIAPSPLFRAAVKEASRDSAVEVVEEYDRDVAPTTIKRSLEDDRRIG